MGSALKPAVSNATGPSKAVGTTGVNIAAAASKGTDLHYESFFSFLTRFLSRLSDNDSTDAGSNIDY